MAGRILLVDPNENSQRTLELTLHAEFLEVLTVASAAAALERLHDADVSLVLATIELPDLPGPDLLRQLRLNAATAGIPNLLLGDDVESLQEAVRGGGIDGILGRPFRAKDLVDQVFRLMREPATGSLPVGAEGRGEPGAEMDLTTGPPRSRSASGPGEDGPESAEVLDGGEAGGGDFFDLAGELDRGESVAAKRPDALRARAEEIAKEIGFGTGGDRTVVVSRDDLQALRSTMGMAARGAKEEPKVETSHTLMMSKEELDKQLKNKKPGEADGEDEVGNFQTMMMSRDELADLREKVHASRPAPKPSAGATATPVGGVRARDTGPTGPGTAASQQHTAATLRPKAAGAPGSEESIEALVRSASHATEEELLRILQKIRPDMADAVRKVAHQLIERIARRVALETAEKRVEEEIARIRKSIRG